jgi:hypothetical protein
VIAAPVSPLQTPGGGDSCPAHAEGKVVAPTEDEALPERRITGAETAPAGERVKLGVIIAVLWVMMWRMRPLMRYGRVFYRVTRQTATPEVYKVAARND